MAVTERESLPARFSGWVSEHPSLDFALAAVLLADHVLVVRAGHGDVLAWLTSSQRQAVYGAGATIVSILGGLAAIGLAQYNSATGERSAAVRRLYGQALRRNWRGILLVTGLTSALCVVALATDRNHDPASSRFVFEFAMLLWGIRFLRLVWLFDATLGMSDAEASDPGRAPAPDIHPKWQNKRTG